MHGWPELRIWLWGRLLRDFEVTGETPVKSMLIYHGEHFLVKLLRLQADQTVSMEWSCPSTSDMLILQLQLPLSHVPVDQLKAGQHWPFLSYGLLRGLMHIPDLFLHNPVSGLFWDVFDWHHQRNSDGSIDGHPPHKLFSLKQALDWYCVLRHLGFRSHWKCQLRQHGLILRRRVNIQCIVFLAQHVWQCEKLELVLLGCWRSTRRCVNDLVCCQNSLCYLGNVSQRSIGWLLGSHKEISPTSMSVSYLISLG